MSARGGRPTTKRPAKKRSDASGEVGTREFNRRAKAAQRKAARRGMVRGRSAQRSMAPSSLLALTRRAISRIPLAARVCALVAVINAACWSLIMPPLQVTDEPDHFAYVQRLAETASLPASSSHEYALEEMVALEDLHNGRVRIRPEGHPIWSLAEQHKLQGDLAQPLARVGSGGVGFAASQPPLYYALETIPYGLASGGTILDRIELMRLMSALMAGLTALFAFLFLREALPRVRWAWTVGALGVAFAPLLAATSGGVTPDAMLVAVSTALFYCLARAFRRGLSQRLAIVIGSLIAIGFLTKLNFLGLVPGAIVGLILLVVREARVSGRRAYTQLLAPALAIALGPGVLYALINILSNHSTFGVASGIGASLLNGHSLGHEISYIWQFYLPRLPGMHNDFGELFTTQQIWFRNLVGLYGWNDTVFPSWVYQVALIPAGLIVALCTRALVADRLRLRARSGELATYALMGIGLLILVGASGYVQSPHVLVEYGQPRYLLPLIVLWGAVLALCARGAGRRWGPVVGVLLVVLVIGHDLSSQLQVIARYYG